MIYVPAGGGSPRRSVLVWRVLATRVLVVVADITIAVRLVALGMRWWRIEHGCRVVVKQMVTMG